MGGGGREIDGNHALRDTGERGSEHADGAAGLIYRAVGRAREGAQRGLVAAEFVRGGGEIPGVGVLAVTGFENVLGNLARELRSHTRKAS